MLRTSTSPWDDRPSARRTRGNWKSYEAVATYLRSQIVGRTSRLCYSLGEWLARHAHRTADRFRRPRRCVESGATPDGRGGKLLLIHAARRCRGLQNRVHRARGFGARQARAQGGSNPIYRGRTQAAHDSSCGRRFGRGRACSRKSQKGMFRVCVSYDIRSARVGSSCFRLTRPGFAAQPISLMSSAEPTRKSRGLIRSPNRSFTRDDTSPQVVCKTAQPIEPTVCARCFA